MKNRWLVISILIVVLIINISSLVYFGKNHSERINLFKDILNNDWSFSYILKTMGKNLKDDMHRVFKYYFSSGLDFKEMSFATSDSDKNIYVIDSSRKRIVKIDSNDKVIFTFQSSKVIELLKKSKENTVKELESCIVEAREIVISSEYECYFVLYSIKYKDSIKNEVIVQYPLNSTRGGIYFIYKNYNPLKEGIERFRKLSVEGDSVYVVSHEVHSKEILRYKLGTVFDNMINEKNTNLIGEKSKSIPIRIPEDKELNELSAPLQNGFYFTTMDGSVYVSYVDEGVHRMEKLPEKRFIDFEKEHPMFPWYIESNQLNKFYFLDKLKQKIYKKDKNNNAINDNIFSADTFTEASIIKLNNLAIVDDNKIVCSAISKTNSDKVDSSGIASGILVVNLQENIIRWVYQASYSKREIITRWFILINWLVVVLFIVFILRFVYEELLQRKVSLYIKQGINIPVIFTAMFLVSVISTQFVSNAFTKDVDDKLWMLSNVFTNIIKDSIEIKSISEPKDYSFASELKGKLEGLMYQNSEYEKREWKYYIALYKVDEDDRIYYILDTENMKNYLNPIEVSYSLREKYLNVYKNGTQEKDISKDSEGEWRFVLKPIKDSNENILGICEVGINMETYAKFLGEIQRNNRNTMFIVFIFTIIIFTIMTKLLLRSLRRLTISVGKIAQENWDLDTIKGSDEVAELSKSVKMMAGEIKKSIENNKKLKEAHYRFVPRQYLKYLQKESILDIDLNITPVEKNISIVITSIRSFDEMTAKRSPEENFQFVNETIKKIYPAIREHNGFIDKYYPSGIMALFPDNAIDAVKAAVQIRKNLCKYNKALGQSGQSVIDLGIAVHTGPFMLGIIGEEKSLEGTDEEGRLDGTVISDNVVLTNTIEKISESMGASILVSKDTMGDFGQLGMNYRTLGMFKLEGREEAVELFDVFEGDSNESKILKQSTKKKFELGVEYYKYGRFSDARECFVCVIKENRDDKAARIYFNRADEYFNKGTPDGWDGALNGRKLVWVS